MARNKARDRDAEETAILDDIDKAIITALQVDGRTSYAKLGPMVGLSQAATRQRVQRLIESGVMQVVAVTDPLKIGFKVRAFLAICVDGDVHRVSRAMAALREVDYLVEGTGRFDLVAEVVCTDQEHLRVLLQDRVRAIRGVRSVETFLFLALVKETYDWGVG